MNFSTPEKVRSVIDAGDDVERKRAENRQAVNDLFNSAPPLDEKDAERMGLNINVSWGEGAVLAHHARRQYTTAFLQPANFFKVQIPLAPPDKKSDWETFITQRINRRLKASLPYFEVFRQKFASVVSHGIGPQIWHDDERWLPEYVAVEDLRIPTDTELSLRNLVWFAIRKSYSPGELARKVFGKHVKPGWNQKSICKILDTIKDTNVQIDDYNWDTQPEKMWERMKQDLGYWSSDAVPVIPLWHFYYLDDEDPANTHWCLKVVADTYIQGDKPDEFLFDSGGQQFAKELAHILHIQFGDLSSKAPFMYHSIRSLGLLLVEPCFWTNLFRCRLLQHAWESFNIWLRSSDPSGRAKAQKVELFDRCFIPEGVSIIPQQERHQINEKLVEVVMSELRQLQQEASSSYNQNIDDGTNKEKTATETMALMQKVNALMGGMLFTAFMYERFHYIEVCRRFCLSGTTDPDCKAFQKECRKFGIPRVWVNVEHWDVQPEVPLGNGNPTMEILQAQQLFAARGALSAEGQQEVLHIYIAALTGNPLLAERLAPIGQGKGITDAQEHAELAFATLMFGVPVSPKPGLSPLDQVQTLLGLLAGVIARIEKTGNMASWAEVTGLQNVAQYVNQLIQLLAGDPQNKDKAKVFAQMLGKLMNTVKGFIQRLSQGQQQNGQNGDKGETQGKLVKATTDARVKEASAAQKMAHKEKEFEGKQRRADIQLLEDQRRENIRTGAEIQRQRLTTFATDDGQD